jgi:DNA-binding GntR family transcriptional regulator
VLLAKRLGVSRTPLREALRMLQREGLVVAEPNRKVRIAELSVSDVEQLYAMRITLEAVAIKATVPRLTTEDFAILAGLLAQIDHYVAAEDFERMSGPHTDFHQLFVAGAGSRVAATLRQMSDHAERYRHAYDIAAPGRSDERREQHRSILEAAGERRPELAAERLVAHYAQTAIAVIRALAPDHDPTLLRTAIGTAAPGAFELLADEPGLGP